MLTGMPPFYNNEKEKLFKDIKSIKIEYPKHLYIDVISLFKEILVRDPDKWLGSGTNERKNIKSHSFFDSVDWSHIYKKLIKSPFKPRINSDRQPIYID